MRARLAQRDLYCSLMRVATCTINVGRGLGNRTMVMDLFSFVDLFFIIELPRHDDEGAYDHENDDYELFPFVVGSGVEVFVKRSMVGLFSLVKHDLNVAGLMYNRMDGSEGICGGVYIWPEDRKDTVEGILEEIVGWDWAAGDYNARHEHRNDPHTNAIGRVVRRWTVENDYIVKIPKEPTFRGN